MLTSTGSVYTFGSNEHGITGHGVTEGHQHTPKKVTGCLEGKEVICVAANDHTACITEDGDTYTWGNGGHGQLGHGDKRDRATPKLVHGLAGKKAKEVACGGFHTIVLVEDGSLYSFGNGQGGQLGHCNFECKLIPTLIKVPLEGKCVLQVSCGWMQSMALTSEGRVYTWGYGSLGQLGHGSDSNYCSPHVVEGLMGYKVVHIVSQYRHSVVLVDDSKRSYSKMMKSMIDDETCSDVVFVLKDGERVHANKGLLMGRSEYFRAMFRSDMRENRENKVEVPDCSKTGFLLLLEYLYKGEVDVESVNAKELYMLSHRYQEDVLSMQCLEVIEAGLSGVYEIKLLNEVDVKVLAGLKDFCMEYVVSKYWKLLNKKKYYPQNPSCMSCFVMV